MILFRVFRVQKVLIKKTNAINPCDIRVFGIIEKIYAQNAFNLLV